MGTKRNPGRFDCYENAEEDEPMFILLARDPIAPLILELWCFYRSLLIWSKIKPKTDLEMIEEARMCSREMTKWRAENWPRPKIWVCTNCGFKGPEEEFSPGRGGSWDCQECGNRAL